MGEVIEEAKYQSVIDLLTGKGVKLTANGEYRATYEILKDIAGIWNELTSMERAGIAEQLAGTRQQAIFYSLIEQFDEASNAMDRMEKSAGALSDAYAIYLDSIQGHIGKFKAEFQDLSKSFILSDVVKDVVDLGTSLLKVISPVLTFVGQLTKLLGGLKGILAGVASAILMLNIQRVISYLSRAAQLTKEEADALRGLPKLIHNIRTASNSAAAAQAAAQKSMMMWNLAAAALAVTLGVVIGAIQRKKQADEESARKSREAAEKEAERSQSLSDLIARYSAIAQKESKEKSDLDEIASIQSSIVDLVGDQKSAIDLVNGSYEKQIDLLNELQYKNAVDASGALETQLVASLDSGRNAYTGRTFGAGGSRDLGQTPWAAEVAASYATGKYFDWSTGELSDLRDLAVISADYFSNASHSAFELRDAWKSIQDVLLSTDDWYEQADKAFNLPGWNHATILNAVQEQITYNQGLIDEAMKDAQEYLSNQSIVVAYQLQLDEPESVDEFKVAMHRVIGELYKDDSLTDALRGGFVQYSDIMNAAAKTVGSKFPDLYQEWQDSNIQETTEELQEHFDTINELFKTHGITAGITDVEKRVKSLTDAWDKWNNGEEFSAEALQALIDEFPKLGTVDQYLGDGIANLGDNLKALIDSAPDELVTKMRELRDTLPPELLDDFDAIIARVERLGKVSISDTIKQMSELTSKVTSANSAVTSAVGSATGITSEQYSQLIALNEEFAGAIEYNGVAMSLNAEKAGKIVSDMANEYVIAIDKEIAANMQSIAALEKKEQSLGKLSNQERKELETLRQSVQQYRVMRAEILETISTYQKWINAQGTSNEDAMFGEVEKAFQHLQNVFTNADSDIFGQWNTDDTLAALELWAGQVDDFMTNGVLDFGRVQKFIDDVGVYMKDGMQGMSTFIDDLVSKGFGEVSEGQFKLYDGVLLRDISEAFGLGTDTLTSFFKFLNTYGGNFHFDDEEFERLKKDADSAAEAVRAIYEDQGETLDATSNQEVFDRAIQDGNASLQRRIELSRQLTDAQAWMDEYGGSMDPEVVQNQMALIEQLRGELDSLPPVKQIDIELMTAAYSGKIAELQAEKELQLQVNADFDSSAIDSEIAEYEAKIGELKAVVDVANVEETNSKLSAVQSVAEQIAKILDEDYTLTIRTSSAYANLRSVSGILSTIITQIRTVNNTPLSVSGSSAAVASVSASVSNVVNRIFGGSRVSGSGVASANGTYDSGSGETLVGELGRELYVDPATNTWKTVGDNGAEFIRLPKHAIIFNNRQTESLLGRGRINGRGTALASGNAMVAGGINLASFRKYAVSASSSAYSSDASSSSNNSDQDNDGGKSAFEKLYEYHKHLIAMDQESMEDFLNWLAGAYQQAYNAGEIELEDYYAKQEEVYNGLRDLFEDYMNDVEAEISDLSHYDNAGKEIMKMYRELLANIEKELQKAYDAGLKDTDDYVQKLKASFWSYYDALQELQEGTNDGAKDAVEELIKYRTDMIRTELNEEKDALKERLSYLKEFYDTQKKMLKDSVEEEDYLKEQAEKRKAVTDLQLKLDQLELDNSAWAQKKRLELEEQLAKAREDLRIFERDHAVKMAEEEFDRIYDAQEKEIDRETDLIDERLDDKKGLYDTSLEDIRNNSMQLYEDMMRYNEKYVDGTPDAVTEMWEEAYKALQEYKTLYDEWYKNIQLVNATGYVPKTTANTGPQATPTATPVSSGYTVTSYTAPVSTPAPQPAPAQPAAPSLTSGSYVEVKPGTKWYADSGGGGAWGWARAGTIRYINERGSHPYNIEGLGWVRKQDIVGYARGTKNAAPGLHRIDEEGFEQVFVSPDGSRYKLFSGGEKVLNAKATNFLYDFAMSGGAMLRDAVRTAVERVSSMRGRQDSYGDIHMGDIIIQGSANERTVSEIRRAQRENIDYVLKEFRKLNK